MFESQLQIRPVQESFQTRWGRARIARLADVQLLDAWPRLFSGLAKDHRYYELVEETLHADFDFHYFVLEDLDGTIIGIQPFFFVAQDLLATAPQWLRATVRLARSRLPRLLRPTMLMAGCAAGEGHPGAANRESQQALFSAAAETFPAIARKHGASLIVWKDFPAEYRSIMKALGGKRMPSMPATRVELGFPGFEEYVQRTLSHAARKDLRRKFKASREVVLQMVVANSAGESVDEIHQLYSQVLARSTLQFERLPREFFVGLGKRMPDRARFFLWRHDGRLVACSICLLHDGILYDEYLGLDYRVALDWHLYFLTLRDLLDWAMRERLREYRSTPLSYAPKRQFGLRLAPLDLYVSHPSRLLDDAVRCGLSFIQPTRAEPSLRKFPNAHEL